MITKGHYIGEIVDMLCEISNQVNFRCRLHLFDLNTIVEDTFKNILNILLDMNLRNLNEDRVNTPGLDLGDEFKKIAFQITSQKTSKKINETLEKITPKQRETYDNFIVFIIDNKQHSYTLNKTLTKRNNFSIERDIWDINDLSKKVVALDLMKLKELYDYLKNEFVKVRIELEAPDKEGNYKTNIEQFVEPITKPRTTECLKLWAYLVEEQITGSDTLDDVKKTITDFSGRLSKMPRLTREFLVVLLDRLKPDSLGNKAVYYEYLTRICNEQVIMQDLALLNESGFIDIEDFDDYIRLTPIHVHCGFTLDCFVDSFLSYINDNNISYNKVIKQIDFSDF